MKNKAVVVKPLIFNTYIAVIKNSVGSALFKNYYAKVNGKKKDIMRQGELSCAFYASSVLVLFKLIKEVHGTVDSTTNDLKKSGWKAIKKPRLGSILVWEKLDFGGETHKHIGFYIGNNKAISNSYQLGYPFIHHWSFNNKRKVDFIFWNQKLSK